MTDTPRVYIACLKSYNEGKLVGDWFDVDSDLPDNIAKLLERTGGEEWAIHDHEGFCGYDVGENPDLDELVHIAEMLEEHGPAIAAYFEHVGGDWDVSNFEDHYHGEWDSEVAYAEDLFDECYLRDVPESVRGYIDYEKWARDLFLSDYFSVESDCGTVYIFSH